MKSLLLMASVFFGLSASAADIWFSGASENQDVRSLIQALKTPKASDRFLTVHFDAGHLQKAKFSDAQDSAYPHGNFYYLIGDLEDSWSHDDYSRFYSMAKWLNARGFRVIINPIAYMPDVREAVQNPQTRALIWNSHGGEDGRVYDAAEKPMPSDIFTKKSARNFKYLLFASCYGATSIEYYHKPDRATWVGWDDTTDSDLFFEYLQSSSFTRDLNAALGIKLKEKSKRDP